MILNKKPRQHLIEFAQLCKDVLGIDTDLLVSYALNLINYYGASNEKRKLLRVNQDLENRWYKSLNDGAVDYFVYSEPIYNSDMFACWTIYSRKYLLNIKKYFTEKDLIEKIKTVVDLGCGAGLTTSAFSEIFPLAKVTGTNIEDTAQIKICRHFASKYGFNIETDIAKLGKTDFVFASEYFEHIKEPIEHLKEILTILNPEILIIANAFGTTSVGHFYTYTIDGKEIEGKLVSKIFNNELVKAGYRKIKTGWWNNRPNLWIKE